MDIYWYGQSFFKVKGKIATVLFDPFEADFTGLKLPKDTACDLVLSSHNHQDHNNLSLATDNALKITGPGEYEVKGVSVVGIATYHDNKTGSEKGGNTIYHLVMDGINIVHLGDLGHELSEEQTSKIEAADILMIPVGGIYTIDAKIAAKVVAQLEPKIVLPMHYHIPELKFDLKGVEEFLKEMGSESVEAVPKLSLTRDKLPEETTVVLLGKS